MTIRDGRKKRAVNSTPGAKRSFLQSFFREPNIGQTMTGKPSTPPVASGKPAATNPAATNPAQQQCHRGGQGRLYTHVVYVRVTEAEWKRLRERAARCHALSLSRFMVRCALQRTNPRAALPTPEERARLERVLFQFHRAALSLKQLAALRLIETAGGSEVIQQLRETALLLERLCHDLAARLRGVRPSGSRPPGACGHSPKDPADTSDPDR